MAPSALSLAGTAAHLEHGVQLLEARRYRDGYHEVGAGELHQPLDFAFVIALARTTEAILEQAMADQLGKGPRPLALPVAADLRQASELANRTPGRRHCH